MLVSVGSARLNGGSMGTGKASDDRRRYPRAKLSILIQYRFDTLDDFLAEYSADISSGGMFIKTDQMRKVGSLVYLQFYLRDGHKLIEGLGKVVRTITKQEAASGDKTPGLGIEFVNFDEESKKLVEQIVGHNLARAKRD
jgi:uncharacterized protein (TIGR02266 family)